MRTIIRNLIATTAIANALAGTTAFTSARTIANAPITHPSLTHASLTRRGAADITGKWSIIAAAPDGAYEAIATFKQEVDTLTGMIESQTLGSAKLAGSVKGDSVKFSFSIDVRGQTMQLRVGGLIRDKDNISGQLEAQSGLGTFPFSARRIP